jgi:hypothetical protein
MFFTYIFFTSSSSSRDVDRARKVENRNNKYNNDNDEFSAENMVKMKVMINKERERFNKIEVNNDDYENNDVEGVILDRRLQVCILL